MDARDLRVSDAEREHVGQLLQRAVGQGMLSLGEFTERMDTTLAAKTRGELNAVLVDLPGIQLVGEHAPQAVPYPQPAPYGQPHPQPQPHFATAEPYRGTVGHPGSVVRGRMSTVKRQGPWQVSPTLHVDSMMSDVTLDFTEAIMTSQVVEIVVSDYFGSISIVVPPEATVDLNAVETVAGSATNKVRTGPPIGPLHVVVRGKVRFGSLTAKHPFGTSWKRMLG
ncbi:DUF1707 SHOCT-like domain-containing protein [Rhodococcus maanshanensis]|uniref:Cell wall-active antibiotics response 4TMS YvqF n=1 Tax=Rhodococcus maanshanensis TaxID=183556 RepID=A0A1H7TH22_9NOCA|nr:DUF1707 domain-containing protein [Rhodococcus maanshanensis]SEL83855.1 Cell wall-active antibiotics response 4TMS YvqF [Rhodococcus maanshanensis]